MRGKAMVCGAMLAAFCLSPSAERAQTAALKRTLLQKIEAPDPGHVAETFRVTIAPHGVVPRHTHPGVELGYLLSGGGTLVVDGIPERTVKAGDSWAIPAERPHGFRNTGSVQDALVVTYVVEKGKPLATPAR